MWDIQQENCSDLNKSVPWGKKKVRKQIRNANCSRIKKKDYKNSNIQIQCIVLNLIPL